MKLSIEEIFAINYLCAHQIGSYATTFTGLKFAKKKAQKKLIELHSKLEMSAFKNEDNAEAAYDNGELIDAFFKKNNLTAGQIITVCSGVIASNTRNYSNVWRTRLMAFTSISKPLHEHCHISEQDLFNFLANIVKNNIILK